MADTAALPITGRTPAAVLPLFFQLPLKNRIGLMLAAALSIALLVAGWLWSQAPDYKVLFTGIADKDGGAVVTALSQMNVPYKMSDSGTAILVPGPLVHETRLKLASQGLPKGGTGGAAGAAGFELMESPKFGITQFQEQVHYQRAIEGELARSIQSLSAVRAARVHIALPRQSSFLKDAQKPTASVLVALYPGKTLERAQINGIMHLVSSSLPDLLPKNVSVVDDGGNLLSQAGDTGKGQLDAGQLAYAQRIEDSYNKRITDILTPLYGDGNVRAQVKAEIDFSEAESTSEAFKPNHNAADAAVRSMQVSEAPGGVGGGAAGVPGALSNQPPATPTAPLQGGAPTNPAGSAGGNAGSSTAAALKRDGLTNAITNYEVDKTIRHVRSAAGAVRRVSAAVVVNHRKVVSGGKTQSHALSESEVTQINALVKEAIGFQKERGDSINVVNAAFSVPTPEVVAELPLWKQPDLMASVKETGKYALIAALALYLVFGVLRPALRTLSAPAARAADGSAEDASGTDSGTGALAADGSPALASPLGHARQIARQDPQVVASVVRNWAARNE